MLFNATDYGGIHPHSLTPRMMHDVQIDEFGTIATDLISESSYSFRTELMMRQPWLLL